MKKLLLIPFIGIFWGNLLMAQDWIWSQQLQCAGNVSIISMLNDENGNTFIGGTFTDGDLSIGATSIAQTVGFTPGTTDGFVCMFNESGVLQWLKGLGGTNNDEVVSLQIIGSELYVLGNYRNVGCIFSGSISLTNAGNWDSFLARYRISDGEPLEAFQIFYGTGVDRVKDFVYNPEQNVFGAIAQYQTPGISFDTVGGTSSSIALKSPVKDLIAFTMNLSGEIINYSVYQTSVQQAVLKFIDLSPNNGYYIGADLFGTIKFNSTDSSSAYTPNSSDVLVLHVLDNLNFDWSRRGGGAGYDHVNSLISDENGFVYTSGKVESDPYFQTSSTDSIQIASSFGLADMYILKYNQNGNFQWIDRKGSIGQDNASGLAIQENLVQYCGNFADTVIFNNDTLTSTSSLDINTSFAIYDTKGNTVSAKSAGGIGDELGQEIGFNKKTGHTIITGWFNSSTIDFGSNNFTNSSVIGTKDGFIAAYSYPFNATFSSTLNVTCNGGNDGRLLATTYYGVGPYTYDWGASTGTGIFTDSLASNLTAGFYSLTITDSRSEVTTISFTISQPSPFVITIDSTNITCNGADNGTLIAVATGNTSPYNYNWTGQNALPNVSTQTSLEPGKYMLLISDANNCTTIDSVTLTQPDQLIFPGTTITNEDPAGSFTGSVDLNVTGGILPYSYSWENISGILPGRVNDTLNNLQEGFYTAHIIDGNNCAVDTTLLVSGEIFRVLLIETSVISCYGYSNGAAIARIVSGDKGESYSYTFTDSIGTLLTAVNDTIINNLTKGWYYVTAQETTGTELRIAIDSILITQPDSLIISLDPDSVSCYGANTGAITLTSSGGTAPINYLWSNGRVTKSISMLYADLYRVVATDKNGCIAIDSAEVEQNDSIEIDIITVQDISCNGFKNGRLQANVTGGVGSFTYVWNDPGIQTSKIATGLGTGMYSVIVKDSKACTNSNLKNLTEPTPLVFASIDSSHVTCYGANDGMIKVSMSGGTPPYNYNWTPPYPNSDSLGGLAPQPFPIALSVVDANSCKNDSFSVFIKGPASTLVASEDLTAHVDNTCFGDALGNLAVLASGGWSGNYAYSIDSINWQPSATFNGLNAQQYATFVRDANGCVKKVDVNISEPNEIIITDVSVKNDTISITATGGTQALQYILNGIGTPQSTGLFDNLDNGIYFIEVSDNENCDPVRSSDLIVAVTGINETLRNISNIYPNPSNGLFKLEIEVPNGGDFNLEIYAVNGTRVYEKTIFAQSNEFKTIDIDLSGSSKGIYLVKINGIVLNSKLILE